MEVDDGVAAEPAGEGLGVEECAGVGPEARRVEGGDVATPPFGTIELGGQPVGVEALPHEVVGRLAGRPVETAVDLIRAGKAGAIYTGRMEFGPRALGARSIIASPHDHAINDNLNKRLDRSEFMPFAPFVLEEDASRVFDITDVNRYAARFMTITCAVKPEWRARIPAVVHVDGTARPQIVQEAANPLFAEILRRFRNATGLPVLINTSFNVHEEPIVNRPEECLQALSDGRVDFVVTQQGVYIRPSS